jgi:GTP cyclohydrolase II
VTSGEGTSAPGGGDPQGGGVALNGDEGLLAVERAVGELRRGRVVVIRDGRHRTLVSSVETLTPDALARLRALFAQELALAVSPERARALGFQNPAHAPLALTLAHPVELDALQRLAGVSGELPSVLPESVAAGPCPRPLAAAVGLVRKSRLVPALLTALLPEGHVDPSVLEVHVDDVEAFGAHGGQELELITRARVPLRDEERCELVLFRDPRADREHLAILVGNVSRRNPVPVRVHSACLTGDVLGSLRCDCGDQLRGAVQRMSEAGGGVLLYLAQEGRGIGLANKLRAYALQDAGLDTFDADEQLGFGPDERSFAEAASMLRSLGIGRIRLLTNNPSKLDGLAAEGIEVVAREALTGSRNRHNDRYLSAKALRAGHLVDESEDSAAG